MMGTILHVKLSRKTAGLLLLLAATSPFQSSARAAGFTNVMHYTFDAPENPGTDASPNQFDINCTSGWATNGNDVATTDAAAGPNARQFFGATSLDVGCSDDATFNAWSNVLSGSFSVSAWIKTSAVIGNDGDNLNDFGGQSGIYFSYNGQGTVPIGITGHKLAFFTGDPDGHQDTLHSASDVTTGSYVHVVATRDGATGQKQIFVNGALDATDTSSTETLTPGIVAQFESIGGWAGSPYTGLMDDVQLYTGVLTSGAVAFLHSNPGSVTNLSIQVPPITLVSEGITNGFYEFSFVSTGGHTNQVQFATNIPTQNWQLYTNIIGDGTAKTILVPTNSPTHKFFRVTTK